MQSFWSYGTDVGTFSSIVRGLWCQGLIQTRFALETYAEETLLYDDVRTSCKQTTGIASVTASFILGFPEEATSYAWIDGNKSVEAANGVLYGSIILKQGNWENMHQLHECYFVPDLALTWLLWTLCAVHDELVSTVLVCYILYTCPIEEVFWVVQAHTAWCNRKAVVCDW